MTCRNMNGRLEFENGIGMPVGVLDYKATGADTATFSMGTAFAALTPVVISFTKIGNQVFATLPEFSKQADANTAIVSDAQIPILYRPPTNMSIACLVREGATADLCFSSRALITSAGAFQFFKTSSAGGFTIGAVAGAPKQTISWSMV